MDSGVRAVQRLCCAAVQKRAYSAPASRAIPAAKQKYVPSSGTYPKGFLVGTAHAGVKASNTQHDDVALVVSESPCSAAAVFTRNLFKAAPCAFSKHVVESQATRDAIRGVVVNSGCANAVTGSTGVANAILMAQGLDDCFGDRPSNAESRSLVMSTGVIGQQLPIDRIVEAIPKAHTALDSTHEAWLKGAQAICTTDTFPKLMSRTFTLPSHPETTYTIAGMTKGAGMIHPNMGTLLGIVATDVKVSSIVLKDILRSGIDDSFNCISVDGDTSTNDTVALLANGAAAPLSVDALEPGSADEASFRWVVKDFLAALAQLVVRDGEGATKFVTVRVRSKRNLSVARCAAESIATSALVKTALYGKDANWGRILCAIGYAPGIMYRPHLLPGHSRSEQQESHPFKGPGGRSGGKGRNVQDFQDPGLDPRSTSVSFVPSDGSDPLHVLVRGEPQNVDEARAKQVLELEDVEILVDLDEYGQPGAGTEIHEAVYWTCDFSHEYVTINGDYRT